MNHLVQPTEVTFFALLSVTPNCGWREIVICTGTDWNASEDKWIQDALIDTAI